MLASMVRRVVLSMRLVGKVVMPQGLQSMETYELPAVVGLTLNSNRPELLNALGDAAIKEMQKLEKPELLKSMKEMFRLIADLVKDRQGYKARLDVWEEMSYSFESAAEDIQRTMEEMREEMAEVDRKHPF